MFAKIDVCSFEQIDSFIQEKLGELKEITLINCASITYNAFAHKSDPEKWKTLLKLTYLGLTTL